MQHHSSDCPEAPNVLQATISASLQSNDTKPPYGIHPTPPFLPNPINAQPLYFVTLVVRYLCWWQNLSDST